MSRLATLGLRPDGDPVAMRAYATSLRSLADQLATAGAGAVAAIAAATFEGPAGDGTRFRADRMRLRATGRGTALHYLADAIMRRAGEVERRQHAWDVLLDQIEADARLPGPS